MQALSVGWLPGSSSLVFWSKWSMIEWLQIAQSLTGRRGPQVDHRHACAFVPSHDRSRVHPAGGAHGQGGAGPNGRTAYFGRADDVTEKDGSWSTIALRTTLPPPVASASYPGQVPPFVVCCAATMADGTVCANDQVEVERLRDPVFGHDEPPVEDVHLCDLNASCP
jgi:hypothetical protein